MAEAPSDKRAKLALALAMAAVAIVGTSIVMVIVRAPAPSVRKSAAATPRLERGPEMIVVEAQHVVRLLDPRVIEAATDPASAVGVRVIDAQLRATLKMETTDVITAISGKPVRSLRDVSAVLAAGETIDISSFYVELDRDGRTLLLEWELAGQLGNANTRRPALAVSSSTDPFLSTITRLSATELSLPRTTFHRIATDVLASPGTGWSAGVRPVPSPTGGIRLFAVRPNTVWSMLGFESGDTIQTANGLDVSVTELRDIYDRLRAATQIELKILRHGSPLTLTYVIQ